MILTPYISPYILGVIIILQIWMLMEWPQVYDGRGKKKKTDTKELVNWETGDHRPSLSLFSFVLLTSRDFKFFQLQNTGILGLKLLRKRIAINPVLQWSHKENFIFQNNIKYSFILHYMFFFFSLITDGGIRISKIQIQIISFPVS